ncbi:MAG TPA: ATP-binding protein [Candidatus Wallbacteria bacterium]|nr:ATP-binding protein [Candidatus Wallbacteria bacterium]
MKSIKFNVRYNITWKIGLIVLVMFFFITLLSLITIYNIAVLDKNANILSNYNDTLKLIESLQLKSNDLLTSEKDKEASFDQQLVEKYRDFDIYMDEFIKKSKKTISSRELKKVMSRIEESRANFNTVLNTAYQAYDSEFGVWDTAEIPMTKLVQKRESLHRDIEELLIKNNNILKDMTVNSVTENRIITIYMVAAVIVIFICVIWFSFYMTKKITFPINKLITAAREIGNGNLDYKVDLTGYDEIGELGQTLNQMSVSLKESNKKLTSMLQLAVAVAHEVRNPVAGIGNAIQVISSKFPKDDPHQEIIAEMINQVNRVDEIISNLLTYARPVPLKLSVMKIRDTVLNILAFIKTSNTYPNVTEEFLIHEEIDPPLNIDVKQFTQVFMNVVINAYQALASTSNARLTITTAANEKEFIINVSDNGPGINEETMTKIFEPFFTTKPKGSGLGLAVSQKIIRSMGGDIKASSIQGKETIFKIIIPIFSGAAPDSTKETNIQNK